jgi:hypothetical protein
MAGVVFFITLLSASMAYSAALPTHLDLFDASDNHLMYIDFTYNGTGQLTKRTVYMSDGTFMRDVEVYADAEGRHTAEVSKNFNGDTSFVMSYKYNGATTSFSIRDQFKLDHVGGEVSYSNADPLNYLLTYSDNTSAARIQYENDASGNLAMVKVYGKNDALQFYGTFSIVGVKQPVRSLSTAPQALVKTRGSRVIDVELTMKAPGTVKCELMSLSGRRAGVVLNEEVQQGNFLKSIHVGTHAKVANGVYLLTVSVNGNVVASSRYLHQAARGGVQ